MPTNLLGWISDLARSHARELARVATSEGLASVDAVDAVQDAFLTFLEMPQARNLAREPDEAQRLMAVLVRNVARNLVRQHHRSRPHLGWGDGEEAMAGGEPGTDVVLVQAEEHLALLGCVRKLAETQRLVVTLRMLEELGSEEVAHSLDLAPGHIAVLLHRAKRSLRLCLEQVPGFPRA